MNLKNITAKRGGKAKQKTLCSCKGRGAEDGYVSMALWVDIYFAQRQEPKTSWEELFYICENCNKTKCQACERAFSKDKPQKKFIMQRDYKQFKFCDNTCYQNFKYCEETILLFRDYKEEAIAEQRPFVR